MELPGILKATVDKKIRQQPGSIKPDIYRYLAKLPCNLYCYRFDDCPCRDVGIIRSVAHLQAGDGKTSPNHSFHTIEFMVYWAKHGCRWPSL